MLHDMHDLPALVPTATESVIVLMNLSIDTSFLLDDCLENENAIIKNNLMTLLALLRCIQRIQIARKGQIISGKFQVSKKVREFD